MSFSGLKEVTNSPKVGIVQSIAMMIAAADAQGELKASFIFLRPSGVDSLTLVFEALAGLAFWMLISVPSSQGAVA
jgi:hypothetical protein